ncbi:MAG: rhomboid family intramembrane serine protease [bacterium]
MSYYERTYRLGFGGGLTKAVKYLLIANCVVYLFQHLIGPGPDPLLIKIFGMHPKWVYSKLHIWTPFTYMFLHSQSDIWHLLFNMFVLWMFGCEVERSLGTREFLKYFVICGVGAGIFHLIVYFNSSIPVVGASGAIYGVMVAFAVLYPERVITLLLFLFFPIQIKAKYLVMIFAGISLFLGVFGSDFGVAHFAHLGGMAVGFAYLKLDWRLDYLGERIRQRRESRRVLHKLKKQQDMQRFRERVDEILDKINEVGYEKLNDEERRILHEASQQFSSEKKPEN